MKDSNEAQPAKNGFNEEQKKTLKERFENGSLEGRKKSLHELIDELEEEEMFVVVTEHTRAMYGDADEMAARICMMLHSNPVLANKVAVGMVAIQLNDF